MRKDKENLRSKIVLSRYTVQRACRYAWIFFSFLSSTYKEITSRNICTEGDTTTRSEREWKMGRVENSFIFFSSFFGGEGEGGKFDAYAVGRKIQSIRSSPRCKREQ